MRKHFIIKILTYISAISSLQAEFYVGGHGGYACPMSLFHVHLAGTNLPPGTTSDPIPYSGAGFGGLTLGYYSEDIDWFGVAFYMDFTKQKQENKVLTIRSPA